MLPDVHLTTLTRWIWITIPARCWCLGSAGSRCLWTRWWWWQRTFVKDNSNPNLIIIIIENPCRLFWDGEAAPVAVEVYLAAWVGFRCVRTNIAWTIIIFGQMLSAKKKKKKKRRKRETTLKINNDSHFFNLPRWRACPFLGSDQTMKALLPALPAPTLQLQSVVKQLSSSWTESQCPLFFRTSSRSCLNSRKRSSPSGRDWMRIL